jgi:polyhydroxyalkanoate synthase
VLLALLAACVHPLPPDLTPGGIEHYRTDDGFENALRHYPGEGPPVLLVHGMGANHYNFDYREGISLASWLQARGWDVWVPELRGDPGSVPPTAAAGRNFSFDDIALHDIPAAVDAVLARTGADKLGWVGHSMGGMLLYTALTLEPERIFAGVAIASPATMETQTNLYPLASHLAFAAGGRGAFPAVAMGRMTAPLGLANPLYASIANVDNLDGATIKGLARNGLVNLPRAMMRQALGWVRDGSLTHPDGTAWLGATSPDVPLLVMGASHDHIVAAKDAAAACRYFPACSYVELGIAGGFSVDYGHVDPVVGTTAAAEVYPLVGAFLDAHRPVSSLVGTARVDPAAHRE